MARETEDDISFTRVLEIAMRIKRIRGQVMEMTSDKRPHHFGGYSGASPKGRFIYVEAILSGQFSHLYKSHIVLHAVMVLMELVLSS